MNALNEWLHLQKSVIFYHFAEKDQTDVIHTIKRKQVHPTLKNILPILALLFQLKYFTVSH